LCCNVSITSGWHKNRDAPTTGDGSCSLMVVLTGIILAALRYLPPQ
jgi:hypothetical protein